MRHPLEQFLFCPKCGSKNFIVNDEKSKLCDNCGFILYNNAAASVACFIVCDEKLLVCKRAKNPAKGTLDLPGGFVDHDETAEEAILREIKEELNLDVVKSRYLFSLPNVYIYSDFEVHTLDLFFLVEIADFSHLHCDDDVASAQFYPLNEIDPEKFGLESVKKGLIFFQKAHLR